MPTVSHVPYSPLLPKEDTTEAQSSCSLTEKFTWNQRICSGTALHKAIRDHSEQKNNTAAVKALLDADPFCVQDRFMYESNYQGTAQSGSGEAIHLAASSGDVPMVALLLERQADIAAKVTRGKQDHYDVLQAAIFGEGRGGTVEMVSFLLERRAPMELNANKHSPLHVAFLTGSPDLINLVRFQALKRGEDMEDDQVAQDPDVMTPLELGIVNQKMTAEQLAAVAPLTPAALQTFTRNEPDCIVSFLARCLAQDIKVSTLASRFSFQDLAAVLRVNPVAAGALLEALTTQPEEDNPAWHALPTRASFAPTSALEALRYWHVLNPPPSCLSYYVPDNRWKYDSVHFQHPEWHNLLRSSVKPGEIKINPARRDMRHKMVKDVDIRVCHVPNLACPEVFAALGLNKDKDDIQIFANPVVQGLISHVWLHGACRVDLFQGLLSLFCLGTMIFEQMINMSAPVAVKAAQVGAAGPLAAHSRRLGHIAREGGTMTNTSGPDFNDWGPDGWAPIPVSITLMGARGIVQLFLELFSVVGYLFICPLRSPFAFSEYLGFGNAYAIIQAVLQIWLLLDVRNLRLRVIVIFLCWGSLLRTCHAFEKIASELLPLQQCAKGLIPSAVLTFIFFCASFHAFFNLKEVESLANLGDTFHDTFSMLFTSELPADPHIDPSVLIFTYIVILVFSVFFLNIFIGVIIEQYEVWKMQVQVIYQQVLCHHCLTYLLAAKVMPTRLLSRRASWVLFFWAGLALVGIQAYSLHQGVLIKATQWVFILCLTVMIIAFYQDPDAPWLMEGGHGRDQKGDQVAKHYLWIVTPKVKHFEGAELAEIRGDLKELLRRMARGGPSHLLSHHGPAVGPMLSSGTTPSAATKRSRTQLLADSDVKAWRSDALPKDLNW